MCVVVSVGYFSYGSQRHVDEVVLTLALPNGVHVHNMLKPFLFSVCCEQVKKKHKICQERCVAGLLQPLLTWFWS